MRWRSTGLAAALLAGLLMFTPQAAGAAPLRAGAAVADITPPVGTPMFAYTARSRLLDPSRALQIIADPDPNHYATTFEPSEGIHTRVRAAALVLERDGERFALVSADLGGLPYALVREVARRIASVGIDTDRLLLTATHTHASTGPIWPADNLGYALLGGDLFDARVFELTAAGIAEAIIRASARLRPARVGTASVQVHDASRNRSLEPHLRNEDLPGDRERAELRSVNRRLTALRVDSRSGRPLAVWSSFAVHPTSLGAGNLLFSGDNVATAQRLVEQRLERAAAGAKGPTGRGAGRGPAPVSVWVNGAEGDVSPDGSPQEPDGEPLHYVPTDYARANLAGRRVADGITRAWRRAGRRMRSGVPIDARRKLVSFDGSHADGEPVGPLVALGLGGIFGPDGACAPVDGLAGPGQGRKLPALVAPTLPGPGLIPPQGSVSLWRIGELGIAALPFEVTTQMGRRITAAIGRNAGDELGTVAIAGMANGYLSYVATPEEYDACHYEGSFTLYGRQQGARLRDVAVSLTGPVLSGAPAPSGADEPVGVSLGSPAEGSPSRTPAAGEVIAEPPARARRLERVELAWRGGDPAVDAPRGHPLVTVERHQRGRWRQLGTEDGPADLTSFDRHSGVWTESLQLGACTPLGRFRFAISGRALRGGGSPEAYRATSRPFRVRPTAPLEPIDATVRGRRARVRIAYPDPGEALLAVPRRVRTGRALLTVRRPAGGPAVRIPARIDRRRLAFVTRVPRGSRIVRVAARDRCGNSTAPGGAPVG